MKGIKELNHIGLRAVDIDKAIYFYEVVLGGKIIRNSGSLDGKSRFVYIQICNSVIELITATEPSAEGFAHIAFILNGLVLDELHQRFQSEGYNFTVLPKAAASGDGRLAFFKDDSDVIYELIERTENIRLPAFTTSKVKRFDHIALNIKEEYFEKAADFFVNAFGFTRIAHNKFALGDDAIEFELWQEGALPIRSIVFTVDDCRSMANYLTSLGYDVTVRGDKSAVMKGVASERIVFVQE